MFPGNHPEINLGLRLLCKAGEEKMAFFKVQVGESTYMEMIEILTKQI